MAQKIKGLLPKVEIIIVGVFFLGFLTWTMSKCKTTQAQFQTEHELEQLEAARVDSIAQATEATISQPPTPEKPPTVQTNNYSKLYVTIDGLNLREHPDLNSNVLIKLPLFEEVYFLNEVTDSSYQINLGYEVATEPYVKVRSQKGHEGWVYGAGVNYYKKKRGGVLE